MYCPNCGNKNAEDQNYCRACGLGLEKIAQSVSEQLPSVAVKSLQERKERLERLGVASLSVFGLGIFGFLLYNIFSKLLLSQGLFVAVLAVLAAIIFLGSGLVSVVLFAKAKELKEAAGNRQLNPSGDTAETTGKLLEPHQQPAFSITDRTTNLLPVDAKKK
ncbi:MAG TPA: zinc ribbon domain-containing protein [Pyrinomonadaceae bacterium]|nr:zinc ribbon domain-containing protein [Pyrinomonadaceae bacterium]